MERFELVIEFVQFFLQHTSDELIKGQALSPAILLASLSTSDILSELGVCIIDVVDLVRYGFKISGRKLEIAGTPNAAFDRQEHDYVFDIFLKLLLPGVEIWKPPRLIEKAVMQNTSFGLDKKIAEFKVSARTHKYGFIEQCMGSGNPVPRSKNGWYELTMIFGIETKATQDYFNTKFSSLEEVKAEGLDPKKIAGIKICVKDGHLAIEGKPQARTSDMDLVIDPSHKRFRHLVVTITPQN